MNPIDELHKLTSQFLGSDRLISSAQHVPAALTPEPYKELLVHDQHMTVAMENFHDSPVAVRVLERSLAGDVYSRKSLLTRTDTGRVVQLGIVRFDLSYVVAAVRDEIMREETPLGRILINYNVLRHIDLGAVLHIAPGPDLLQIFGCAAGQTTYGRLATIFCNRQPAVDLLEIAAPVD